MSMKPLYLYKKLSPEKAKYLSVTEIATRNAPIIIVQIKECKLKPLQNLILILLPYTFANLTFITIFVGININCDNMKTIKTFILALSFVAALSSCSDFESNPNKQIISDAKDYFENSTAGFVLPTFKATDTKGISLTNDFIPEWNSAIVTETADGRTVEIPIGGPKKLGAAFITKYNCKTVYSTATTKSYLVIEYSNNGTPAIYIETFIQKGKQCNMTKYSGIPNARGFIILSDLNGNITEQRALLCGQEKSITNHNIKDTATVQAFVGYRLVQLKTVFTKAVSGCPEYTTIICPQCHCEFYDDAKKLYLSCPSCGFVFNDNIIQVCPKCGNLEDYCTCVSHADEECAPCGRHRDNCDNGCECNHNCLCE